MCAVVPLIKPLLILPPGETRVLKYSLCIPFILYKDVIHLIIEYEKDNETEHLFIANLFSILIMSCRKQLRAAK